MDTLAAVSPDVGEWDRLIDNPFNIGAFARSFKAEEWWVITGMQVNLPEAMASRPAGTSKLLVFADTIHCGASGPSTIRFDGLDEVLLIGLTLIDPGQHTRFRRSPLIGDETFRIAFFSQHAVRGQSFAVLVEGAVRGDRYVTSETHRWGGWMLQERRLVEFYTGGPNEPRFGVDRWAVRFQPMPGSGPAFNAVGRTLLARLLLTAQSFFDANRADDGHRMLERFDALVALVPTVPSWQALSAQCTATREMLQQPLPGPDRVPALAASVYGQMARSSVEALKVFASQFDQFTSRTLDLSHRKRAATLLLQREGNALRFQDLVTRQLTDNLDAATASLQRAQMALDLQSERVDQAQRQFADGMDAWRDQERIRANRAIAGAVFSAVTGIAMTLAGKPADVAGIAQRISATVEEAAKIAVTLQKLAKLIQTVARLVKMINEILPAVRERINAATLATRLAAVRRESVDSRLDGAPSESAYWDQFALEIDEALAPAIEVGIPGGAAYLMQLRILIIYGRALTSAQAAVAPIAQELAQADLLTKIAKEQHASIAEELRTLEAHTTPVALTAALWLRHRSVRREVFAALQDFDAAHHYWALSTERPQRNPNRPIADLGDDLLEVADLDASVQRALKSFDPRPQDFQGMSFAVPEDALADFLREGHFTLRLTPDFGPFAGLGKVGRVRVREVAAWVIWNGEPPPTMEFSVRTDGTYYDQRVQSRVVQEFHFIAPRVNHTFRYNTGDRSISIEASVAHDFRHQYSEPTLFTAWQFSLPRDGNADIPPAAIEALQGKVKGIELQFTGSFIKDADRFL